ncbi:MAG: nucleotidyltransferase family protein [Deltaproteobacteria bacterium]|nr:nucleotidyltransferase family protein [Deltaproteobacteria bacterium]
MERQQVSDKLRSHQAELRRLGVRRLSLFGSAVRNEANPGSDVDLLVELSRPMGLFDFFRLQHRLEEILGVEKVDLVQPGALHPDLKENILAEARHVA